ncbi:MAG TPA: hypothetical protein VJM11_09865 [Nevskiaceae bacterium]|nr:hypothetical protein [Nevskiaceae bacterium]
MYKALVPVAALLCSSAAYASCDGVGRTLFACATAQGNRVEVCEAGSRILYAFGEAGAQPQLVASVPRDQVRMSPWRAQGQVESYSVQIPYREAVHVVHFNREAPNAEPDAGVDVLIDREYKTTIRCASGQIANHLASTS